MKFFNLHGSNSWINSRDKTKLILETLETLMGFFFFGFEVSSMSSNLQFRFQVFEQRPSGTIICDLIKETGLHLSESDTKQLKFRFLSEQSNTWFRVDSTTGIVETNMEIDRDHPSFCRQKEICQLNADVVIVQPFFQIIKLVVDVLDINDNSPIFRDSLIVMDINEAATVNSSYILPTAVDYDSPAHGIEKYELINAPREFSLSVLPKLDASLDLKLVLNVKLDRETVSGYRLLIVAIDGGPQAKSGSLFVDVVVIDSNDNQPRFNSSRYEVIVQENKPIGSHLIRLQATDPDSGVNGQVSYAFSSRTINMHGNLFGIRNDTGEIFIKGLIDREKNHYFQLVVVAYDASPDPLSSEVTVVIKVEDINDNAPQITFHTLSIPTKKESFNAPQVEIPEDVAVGAFVAQVSVVDIDSGINGQVNCTVVDRTFSLVRKYPTEYQLEVALPLDREKTEIYNVNLRCQDGAVVSRVSDKNLKVIVTDVNDNSPSFTQKAYKALVNENNLIGVSVLQVTATDDDSEANSQIEYFLHDSMSPYFRINQKGVISAQISLDRESQDSYNFLVYAVDRGTPRRSGSAVVLISVGDVNDERPQFSQHSYRFTVIENQPPGTQVGQVIGSDKDGPDFNEFVFSLFHSGPFVEGVKTQKQHFVLHRSKLFTIDRDTGMISTLASIDREATSSFYLTAVVSDKQLPSLNDESSVVIDVIDENDNNPEIIYPSPSDNFIIISNRIPAGDTVAKIVARDADNDLNAQLNFKILEDRTNQTRVYFKIDQNSGEIKVLNSLLEFEEKIFPLTILVTDSGLPSRRASPAVLNIHVNKSIPFVTANREIVSLDPWYFKDSSTTSTQEWVPLYHVIISTAVFLGCLILVIFFLLVAKVLRKRDQRKDQRVKFNATSSEALRMLNEQNEGSPYKVTAIGDGKVTDDTSCISPLLEMNQSEKNQTEASKSSLDQRNACHASLIFRQNFQFPSGATEKIKKSTQTSILKAPQRSHESSRVEEGRPVEGNSTHVSHNRERNFPPPPPPPRDSPHSVRFSPTTKIPTVSSKLMTGKSNQQKKISFCSRTRSSEPQDPHHEFQELVTFPPSRSSSFIRSLTMLPSLDDAIKSTCVCPGHQFSHNTSASSYLTLQSKRSAKKSNFPGGYSTLKMDGPNALPQEIHSAKNDFVSCQRNKSQSRLTKKVRIEESVKADDDDDDDDDVV